MTYENEKYVALVEQLTETITQQFSSTEPDNRIANLVITCIIELHQLVPYMEFDDYFSLICCSVMAWPTVEAHLQIMEYDSMLLQMVYGNLPDIVKEFERLDLASERLYDSISKIELIKPTVESAMKFLI